MYENSQLVTKRPTGHAGSYYVDPFLSEREFTRWLTLAQRQIPKGDQDDAMDRVAAYHGALLDEFFATLPQRIAFWVSALEEERAKVRAREEVRTGEEALAKRDHVASVAESPIAPPLFSGNGETVGTSDSAAYIERLEWVALQKNNPEFLALNSHHRFWLVAIALSFGIDSATRYLRGETENWGDDELQDGLQAKDELEFLIFQQRGSTVQFRPPNRLQPRADPTGAHFVGIITTLDDANILLIRGEDGGVSIAFGQDFEAHLSLPATAALAQVLEEFAQAHGIANQESA
jgi:hypothetical protein